MAFEAILQILLSNSVISLDYASLVLRLLIGVIFLAHGWPKIKDPKMMAGFLGGIGFRPGIFWAVILAAAEFFGAIAILLGIYVKIAVIPLIISMSVATYLKKFAWNSGFVISKENHNGYEFDLLIIAGLVALLFLGAGSISIV